jgi:hypothetical protein
MSNAAKAQQFKFLVARGDEQSLGPWTVDEIATLMAKGDLSPTDFAYDEAVSDWVALFELRALKQRLQSKKPKVKPHPMPVEVRDSSQVEIRVQASETNEANDHSQQWYIQKGPHQYGPFSYAGVIRALQEKTVYEFDLICIEGTTEWIRIAEHAEFTNEKVRDFQKTAADAESIFLERKHPRLKFDNEVIVHDNRSAWLGRTFEVSQGGSGLVIDNAALVPGQTISLHFAGREDLPAFNAVCEIVSKRFAKDIRDQISPVAYNVRFVKLDSQAAPLVKKYLDSKAKSETRLSSQ